MPFWLPLPGLSDNKMIYPIEIKNAYYRYPNARDFVLRGINLKVERGEFVSLMGPTGAGKSTLCLTLNGILPHSLGGELQGEVRIMGKATTDCTVPELAQKVGIVFQESESQLFSMSVEEEVAFGPENLGVDPVEIRERVDWALEVVRMKEYSHQSPFKLSGGQKQRVAIAAALSMLPDILILDEPTSELDPVGKMEVFSVVSYLKEKQNITVVIVEHESEEIARFSDRILVLEKGEIVLEDEPRKVLGDVDRLKEIRLCPPHVCELASILNRKLNNRKNFSFLTLKEAKEKLEPLFLEVKNCQVKVLSKKDELESCPDSYCEYIKNTHPIIFVENLHFRYEGADKKALKGINLNINQGEFVAIIGQNGAGKTTLVKHFNGTLKPGQGNVYVEGVNTRKETVAELSRKVGYVYQNPDHQIFCSTVEEEVAFGSKNLGLSGEEIKKRVQEAISIMGLESIRGNCPSVLGLGERRKVSLASIISMKPHIIILDEPTTGVDWETCLELMRAVRKLNREGHTIIMISHNMRMVAEHARRVIILGNGEVILDSSTRKVFSQSEILKKTFLIPPQITRLAQSLGKISMREDVLSPEEFYLEFIKKAESEI